MRDAEREELIERMAKAAFESGGTMCWSYVRDESTIYNWIREARAALAVAEPVIREWADNALREENARLLAALKPFGEALKDNYYHQIDALPIVAGSNQMDIRFKWTLGDLRAAAAALKETGE